MFLNFVILVGIFISLVNFFTSINKKTKASGIPLFGSLLLFISLFFIKSDLLFYILIIIILLDTGGLHWFMFMMLSEFRKKNDH